MKNSKLKQIIEEEKRIHKTNKGIMTEHKKLTARREDFNSRVVAHLLENRVGHPVDVSRIEEGVWDSIKFGLSKLGSLEKGGKMFGDRKGRTAAAEKEMQDSIDKASSEAVNTMVQELTKEYPGWPNIKDSNKFAESMMIPLIAYDSIVSATKKNPDAEGYMPPEAANGAIEAIEKVLKFNLDYKLADIYKHTNEEKELEGGVIEEAVPGWLTRAMIRKVNRFAEKGYENLRPRQQDWLETHVAKLQNLENSGYDLGPTQMDALRTGREVLADVPGAEAAGILDPVDVGADVAADVGSAAADVGADVGADAVADVGADAVADAGADAASAAADAGGAAADAGGAAADAGGAAADAGGAAADAANVGGGGEGMSEAAMAAANSAALKTMLVQMGIVVAVGAAALAFGRYKMAKSSRNSQMNQAIKELKPVEVPAGQELGGEEGTETPGQDEDPGAVISKAGETQETVKDPARQDALDKLRGGGDEEEDEGRGDIYVFQGKGGKGMQSQFAKSGIKGGDMSRLLKGLRSDLTAAGFNVLEEAKRDLITLTDTLAALEQIADPAQKEAAKSAIVQMLRQYKVKLDPQSSMALRPAESDYETAETVKGGPGAEAQFATAETVKGGPGQTAYAKQQGAKYRAQDAAKKGSEDEKPVAPLVSYAKDYVPEPGSSAAKIGAGRSADVADGPTGKVVQKGAPLDGDAEETEETVKIPARKKAAAMAESKTYDRWAKIAGIKVLKG